MALKFGLDGKLYYCAAGIGGTPTWLEFTGVKNVTNPNSLKEVDVTTRANAGYEATDGRLKQTHIECEVPLDPTNAGYQAVENAYVNNSVIGVADMTGTITTVGERGLWADCKVTQFDREENIDGVMMMKITFKPCYSANPPIFKIVTA